MSNYFGHLLFYWSSVQRTVCGNSDNFEAKVGVHQGLPLSPLLLAIGMDAISRQFRDALPWELLYAYDLIVIAHSELRRTD